MNKRIAAYVLVLAAFAAVAGGAALRPQPTTLGKTHCGTCPLICSEVTCDNGRTYCNACLAACAGAHNCVPGGQ